MSFKVLSVILGIALLAFAAQAQASTIDVNVLSPNGGEFISQTNGNYRIQFQIFDSNNELDANANIYYTLPLTSIVQNLNLRTQANCTSLNFTTNPTCYYDWNTSGINAVIRVRVSITDSQGSTANDESDNFVTIDNTAPSGLSILINNGTAATNNPEVSLSLTANSDANQMQFSCDNSNYSGWENFATTKTFNTNSGSGCSSGDGNKTVYFKAKDKAGNISAIAADSIMLDTIPPTIITSLDGAIQGNESIALDWSKPAFDGADVSYYKVYKSTAPVTESSRVAFYYAQTGNTYLDDFNIEKRRTYYYYVTSVDFAGNESLLSSEKSFIIEGFVRITADKNSFSMQEETSESIELEIFNDSKITQDITLDVDTDDTDLIAELGSDEFSLNKNERTNVGLSIIAQEGVSSGNHEITVTMYYGDFERTLTINVRVGSSSFASFEALETSICNDSYTLRIPVDVTNLSGSTKNITLSASNNTFLPYWEDNEITLTGSETETIDLLLHNTPSSELTGDYTIQVSAESGSSLAIDEITIELEDCEGQVGEADFTLSVDVSSIDLSKGSAKRINYHVSNTEDFDQYIHVSIETDLQADYNSLIFVRANRTYYDTAIVRAGVFQDAKNYDFKIKAWNDETTHERTVTVRVLSTHYFEFNVSEQDFDLRQGQTKTLSIEFKNSDYIETFTLELENSNSKINAGLSETSFTLSPKTSKTVTLNISANEDANLGSKTLKVKARTNSISQKSLEVGFNVKESIPTPESLLLEIESYPTAMQLNPGESKELTFVIFNPAKNVAFVNITLEDLPEGVSFEEVSEPIASNQRKTITTVLTSSKNAEVGEFEIPISVEAFGLRQTKHLELSIGQQGLFSGIIAGFLSLGESVWLGVLALIVIIVLLWLFGKLAGPSRPKETWVQPK